MSLGINNFNTNSAVQTSILDNNSKSSGSSEKTKEKADFESQWNEDGATYEKSEKQSKGLYTINKMSQEERSNLINQLNSELDARKQQLVDLVQKTLTGQVNTFGKAQDDDSIWKKFANGEFKVDPQTQAQAKKDIAEDGYWGVKQTSQRMFDFACALAGDDPDKMKEMQAAVEKGFKEATKAWGKDLPDISKKTLDATNQLFENYYKSKGL